MEKNTDVKLTRSQSAKRQKDTDSVARAIILEQEAYNPQLDDKIRGKITRPPKKTGTQVWIDC